MKKTISNYMKLTILVIGLCIVSFHVDAQDNLAIIQELDEEEIVHVNSRIERIGGGNVWRNYRLAAKELSLSERWASGIITWDDVAIFLTLIVGFLSQIGLVVGVIFIMYAGYIYMLRIFSGKGNPKTAIKNAIIGVIIVIFSYAILKFLTSLIGLS